MMVAATARMCAGEKNGAGEERLEELRWMREREARKWREEVEFASWREMARQGRGVGI